MSAKLDGHSARFLPGLPPAVFVDGSDHGWWFISGLAGSPVGGIALGLLFPDETCTQFGVCTPTFNMDAAAYSTLLGWGLTAAGYAYFWLSDRAREERSIPVPDVTGIDQAHAIAELARSNLRAVVVEESTTNPADDGRVVWQFPQGGTRVDPRASTPVSLRVGRVK